MRQETRDKARDQKGWDGMGWDGSRDGEWRVESGSAVDDKYRPEPGMEARHADERVSQAERG